MKSYPISIKPFGERAVLVEWPEEVSESILADILDFMDAFKELEIPGWEMSVAYNSLTMVYNQDHIDFEETKNMILECQEQQAKSKTERIQHLWTLPVCYDLEFGMDIEEAAKTLGISVEELIQQHTSHQYVVYGIGFLPGFMYLGGLPSTLEIPRRAEPRLKVQKGSVGLASKQTGIYPQDSPGGWNIIGNCPVDLFNPMKDEPCFVKVGDKIQFERISKAEYKLHKIEGEVGIYEPEKVVLNA
ncbi:5-oxoprolinase subunit PxpB [Muricauda oceani]|uniref:5-oxoprolinase subunit PxpB n=1 Tax=Flagellimonas oceani TaxID=2698672 RepID=A0A6G7J1W7_9FLAO|nr:5-oxoprolinase subunit PxpB [Allomuricauda oceani]MBW8241341.1 5-oxoprolinase subunit PxpB [Allomuricauda oceani]QII44660.1 5-oxoprolinase subunit PxpB [Allomuricauda oceani]